MTNPRKTVDFTGIDYRAATYKIDGVTITYSSTEAKGSAVAGRAVEISAGSTVALVNDGNPIAGRLELVEADGHATVQFGGFCRLPGGAGALLTNGRKIVGALDAGSNRGFIRVPATLGATYDAAAANAAMNADHLVIDNTTTTAVVVLLG